MSKLESDANEQKGQSGMREAVIEECARIVEGRTICGHMGFYSETSCCTLDLGHEGGHRYGNRKRPVDRRELAQAIRALSTRTHEQQQGHSLEERLAQAEMDRDYYHALVDGSWPHADDLIEFARHKRAIDQSAIATSGAPDRASGDSGTQHPLQAILDAGWTYEGNGIYCHREPWTDYEVSGHAMQQRYESILREAGVVRATDGGGGQDAPTARRANENAVAVPAADKQGGRE